MISKDTMMQFVVAIVFLAVNQVRKMRRERSYVPELTAEYFRRATEYLCRRGVIKETKSSRILTLRNGKTMKLYSTCARFEDDKLPVVKDSNLKGNDLTQTFRNVFEKNCQRPCLGAETSDRKIFWFTYKDIYSRAQKISSELRSIDLIDVKASDTTVGIYGKNSIHWICVDLACLFGEMISVPLHTSFSHDALISTVNRARIGILFIDSEYANYVVDVVKECKTVSVIVLMHSNRAVETKLRRRVSSNDVKVYTIEAFLETREAIKKKKNKKKKTERGQQKNKIFTVLFTSGSTGTPKGVPMLSHQWNERDMNTYPSRDALVAMSHMPLSHITDRHHVYVTLFNGGRVGVVYDSEKLMETIQLVRPTILFGAPAVFDMVRDIYRDMCMASPEESEESRQKRFRHFCGGRLKLFVSGGAALDSQTREFLQKCFRVPEVIDGYGSTETGNIAIGGKIRKGVDLKTLDVPELNMFSTDKPFSRGECAVKTADMFPGYFNDDDRTKSAFTSDGYYKTGDLVEHHPSSIRIIGRRKHAIKLSKAQWVHPGALELIFGRCDVVEQIYVHGVANAAYLVAIVHPNRDILMKSVSASSSSSSSNFRVLCTTKKAKEFVLSSLRDVGNKAGIQDFEQLKYVYLEFEEFTEKNKMLTSSCKLSRPNIRVKYREILNEMLGISKKVAKNTLSTRVADETEKEERSSLGNITKYCVALLGNVSETDLLDSRTLSLHGLQSLGMQRVKSYLEQRYKHLHIPVEIIGAVSIRTLASIVDTSFTRFLARELKGDFMDRALSSIENNLIRKYCDESKIEIQDLSPDDIMSRTIRSVDMMITRAMVPPDPKIKSDCMLKIENVLRTNDDDGFVMKNRTIVLTGVTGFVGPFLLQEMLKRGHHVVCFVRAKSDDEARERVLKNLKTYEIKVHEKNIEVHRFSLICDDLGLSKIVYEDLISRVTDVHHLAARVNFRDPYATLRDPNVMGVVRMMKFASRAQNKQCRSIRFHYYSTTDVLPFRTNKSAEKLSTEFQIPRDSGYAQTKYVSEKLVSRFHEKGLRCTIHRLCMIGPCYSSGATNPNDFVARMLRGLAQMRAVPSFTESYVHMIPVDVCAKVVVAMGETLSSVGVALNYDGRSTTCSSNRKRLDFDTLVSGVERCLASSMDRLSYDKWCDLIHFNETNPLHSIWSRDSKSFPKFDRRIVYAKNTHKIVCDELGV